MDRTFSDPDLLKAELLADHRVGERRFLADMLPKNGVGAEIGVFTGLFSAVLLEVARPQRAYFVDPWWEAYGRVYPDWGSYTAFGKLRTRVAHDAAAFRIASHASGTQTEISVETSIDFFSRMPDRFFDWIYLDSTHSYQGTVAELAVMRSKLKAGAVLAGDDWLDDPLHKHHGVAKAVTEAVARGEYKQLQRLSALQWTVRAL